MKIPKPRLKKSFLANIEAIVGAGNYSTDDLDRLSYCRDSNFRAAIQAHYSVYENFPAVIVWPHTVEQVAQLIKAAKNFKVAVTPYGGGSGVCGGAVGYNGGMTIDTKRMNRLLRLDTERLFADVQAGIQGLELENRLARQGFTLGHFPSSILSACLGGYLATRSAGQASSKYGKIEDMVIDLEFVDGNGRVFQTSDVSRGQGLDFTQMIVGSEGRLGLITRARLKVYPKPACRVFKAFSFKKLGYGIEALRRIMQTGLKPDILRLYDELDSLLLLITTATSSEKRASLGAVLPPLVKEITQKIEASAKGVAFRAHRVLNELARFSWLGCLLVVVLEGPQRLIEEQARVIAALCEDLNATPLADEITVNWYEHRYSVSYKASKLFRDGAFTDTIEVATTWDNLERLTHGIKNAIKPHALVLAHISHVYPQGAAVYFTFVAPLKGPKKSLAAYDQIWKTALDGIQYYGGVLSHHHGIGRLKKSHIRKEWGEAAQLFQKLKTFFDPEGILNPEVLC